MMQILIPNSFIEERTYIVNVLLKEFLGLGIEVITSDVKNYIIKLENGKKLIINDSFFSLIGSGEYLNKSYLPKKVKWLKNPFIVEDNIPVLYGSEKFEVENNKIECGIDVFASSFLMLTRWEEYVNGERDTHNRFPASSSLAYKNGFLNRPIVNEYVEMIWNIFIHLGIEQKRKKREFQFINTHDVDHIYKWSNLNKISKVILGDIIKRKNIGLAVNRLKEYSMVLAGKQKDPFDTFDWLMEISTKANIKSHFYFMSGGETHYDNNYKINEKKSLEVINKIIDRGHIIGFHPSYNSYNDPVQWKSEKEKLESILENKITEGRQHYLRFDPPYTWQIWSDNGMQMDSTLSYPDKEGFRCGVCYEYPVFNFLTKKELPLKEYPLIIMETSLLVYQSLSSDNIMKSFNDLITVVKKYNGNFVMLWHNSGFVNEKNINFREVYYEILNGFNELGR